MEHVLLSSAPLGGAWRCAIRSTITALLIVALCSPGFGGQGTLFQPPVPYLAGQHPVSTASGDLDGDGNEDVVVADRTDDLYVFLGTGSGALQGPVVHPIGNDPRRTILADLDLDGDLDVATVCAGSGSQGIVVHLNDGAGNLGAPILNGVGEGNGPQDFVLGDLDEDGDLDACVTEYWTHQVAVLLNDGFGAFTVVGEYALKKGGASVTLADLDEDTHLDMIATGSYNGVGTEAFVFLGGGQGAFGPRSDYPTGGSYTADIVQADLDGDGHIDVVVLDGLNLISVLPGDGSGSLGAPVTYVSAAWQGGLAGLVSGDFDQDGSPDVGVSALGVDPTGPDGLVSVFLNDGQGILILEGDYPAGNVAFTGRLCASDLDANGRPDLVVPNYHEGTVSVLLHAWDPVPTSYCTAKANSLGCVPTIGYSGTPTLSGPDDFHVTATNELNNKVGIMIWSDAPHSAPFMGGTLCVAPPIHRTPHQVSGGNPPPMDCSGTYSFHFSQAYMSSMLIQAGTQGYAQYWSRDPGFPPPLNVGLTDGLRFVVGP